MTDPRRACCTLAVVLAVALPSSLTARVQREAAKKPTVSLRVTPPMGFSPLRVRVVAELREGSDDYEEFYCPSVEWEWGDGTISENSSDCDPYEAGKSTIERRFTGQHVFRQQGQYRIFFRLKQKDRMVGSASVNVQVRAGAGEGFGE